MSAILHCIKRKIKTPKGLKRYWEQNKQLLGASGFSIGDRFNVEYSQGVVVIEKSELGTNKVSHKSGDTPVIDLLNKKMSDSFEGIDSVLVEFYKDKIVLTLSNLASKAAKRLLQIKNRIKNKLPLVTASLFAGIMGLDLAIKDGLKASGIDTRLAWANEYDDKIAELSLKNNPLWKDGAKLLSCSIQELDVKDRQLESPDILMAGLPCIGHSSMQTNPAKRGVYHPSAGLLFVDFLRVVHQSNPAVIIVEQSPNFIKNNDDPKAFGSQNVDHYVIERYLEDLHYSVSYKKVNGHEHGQLEKRERTLLVAVTQGIDFDVTEHQPVPAPRKRLGSYLDSFSSIPDSAWSEMPYLAAKTLESSNNFGETLVSEESLTIPVFTATYAKRQPNTPIIKNKNNPSLKRLATPQEHARIKHLPESLVAGANQTIGHKALGNSVQKDVFSFYAKALGLALLSGKPAVTETNIVKMDDVSSACHVTQTETNIANQEDQLSLFS